MKVQTKILLNLDESFKWTSPKRGYKLSDDTEYIIENKLFPMLSKYGITFRNRPLVEKPGYVVYRATDENGNTIKFTFYPHHSDMDEYQSKKSDILVDISYKDKTERAGIINLYNKNGIDEAFELITMTLENMGMFESGNEEDSKEEPKKNSKDLDDLIAFKNSLKEEVDEDTEQVVNYIVKKYYDPDKKKFTINVEDRVKNIVPANEVNDVMEAINKKVSEMASETSQNKPTESETDEVDKLDDKTRKVGETIVKLLKNYNVDVTFKTAEVGPSITQYEFELKPGTKISAVSSLSKELAMGLSVKSVSISPVEGKTTIGIQVPNEKSTSVELDDVLEKSDKSGVSVALGKDTNGNAISGDLIKMQHVLIGGSTGSGKSACINTMICSLIKTYTPDQVKLILIDPKKVELSQYKSIPHLLKPIVTDPQQAADTLDDLVDEMQDRYDTFSKVGVKNIESYNNLVDKYNASGKSAKLMPYIVCIIDELADLMMTAGKQVESSIQRLTQLSRAAGIHLIVATQRPSVDVVTGTIKSNIASRIAFTTASGVDSKTILDQGGAEKLLGKGDMLFKPVGSSNAKRIQGAYVSDDEVDKIVSDTINKYGSNDNNQEKPEETVKETDKEDNKKEEDENYNKAVALLKDKKKISTSIIQLELHLPFSEAQRILKKMKDNGIIKKK